MVIEVTKEVDCIRIGVDKYSVRTGLKIKSVMVVYTRVLKEPRGFIRILQCLLAILAFATTADFSETSEFKHICDEGGHELVNFTFGYPFSLRGIKIWVPPTCSQDDDDDDNNNHFANGDDDNDFGDVPIILPFDFSVPAEFYVATGVISFLYTIIILIVYTFMHQQYANDPKIPAVDLLITSILTVFWLAGSSAWAEGVANVKYYMHPDSLFGMIQACQKNHCETVEEGDYTLLNVSLVFGFACFLLWACSLWFVYKETVFHTPAQPAPDPSQNQTKGDGRV